MWTVFLSFRFVTGGPGFGVTVAFGCVYSLYFCQSMGRTSRNKPRHSLNGSQRDPFPVGELARKRAALRAEYLSKSKELCAQQKQIQRLKNKVSLSFFVKRFTNLKSLAIVMISWKLYQLIIDNSPIKKKKNSNGNQIVKKNPDCSLN